MFLFSFSIVLILMSIPLFLFKFLFIIKVVIKINKCTNNNTLAKERLSRVTISYVPDLLCKLLCMNACVKSHSSVFGRTSNPTLNDCIINN